MTTTAHVWRQRLSTVLLVAAFVLSTVGGPVLYASSVVDNEDAFVAVAELVAAHPDVRTAIAESVTTLTFDALAADEAVADILPDEVRTFAVPITRIASTQLTEAAFGVLDTDIVVQVQGSALRELHRQVTADSDEVVIDLRAVLVHTSRELGGPTVGAGVAKFVSGTDTGRFTLAEPDSSNSRLLAVVRAIPVVGGMVAIAALATLVGSIAVATDRRRALVRAGLALAAGAVAATALVTLALFAVLGRGSAVSVAVADVVATDFAQQQRGAILNGIVLAGIGLMLGSRPAATALRSLPGDLWHRRPNTGQTVATVIGDNPPLARVAIWLGGLFAIVVWSTPTVRVLVSIIAVTLAGQVVAWVFTSPGRSATQWRSKLELTPAPGTTANGNHRLRVNLAVVACVLFLVWPGWSRPVLTFFFGLIAISQASVDLPAARRLARVDSSAEPVAPQTRSRRYAVAAVVGSVVAAMGLWSTAGSAEQVEVSTTCNGVAELCERRIDEVVFAGSHNAMSSTDLGWELAMQSGDIVTQLDHGIRALLIDALYWDDTGRLDGDNNEAAFATIEAALSDDEPRPGTWLCHGFCALGATDLVGALTDIDLWLAANPREVLLIVIQDEVTAADIAAAFDTSGLSERVHTHQPGTPFPTLAQLIEADERLLVYAENEGTPSSWYQNAWDSTFTETPFTFALRSEFSCAPNRGSAANPLFLINHWLTTGIPVREAAAAVNSRDALLERVEACRAERGRLPTILATDFVQTGDLVEVVNELNGAAD